MITLAIEHIVTADDPFGEPWPPDGACSIVRCSSHGFTLWRRISQTHANASPSAPRAVLSPAVKQTQHSQQLEQIKEYDMSYLSSFRQSANRMRSGEGRIFDGDFVSFNGENGGWKAGKDKVDIDGHHVIAAVNDLIVGWQNYRDDKFEYVGHGFVRDRHEPPLREELDDADERYWKNKQDPWKLTYYLAMFNPETRRHFVFSTSSGGGKDALANLQEAFADHNEGRALEDYELPLVELASDSYVNSYGKKIHKPVFEIIGWVKAPQSFRLQKPPAATVMTLAEITKPAIEHKAAKGKKESAASKPKPDFDDGVPSNIE